MTRLVAIVAALIVVVGVVATSGVYAAPHAVVAVSPAGDLCAEGVGDLVVLKGKVCAKRHSLGLPCAPQAAALPAAPLADVPARAVIQPLPPLAEPGNLTPSYRLFRPPRPRAA